MSSNTRLALVTAIIAIVLVGGFFLSTPHTREVRVGTSAVAEASTTRVTLKDAYRKGVHEFTGSVVAPDACAAVSAAAAVATSTGDPRIALDLSMPATAGLCLEVPTAIAFSVTLAAPPGLPVDVRINGALATTTL